MQKTVLLAVLLALVLSGCAPQGKEIILTDSAKAASGSLSEDELNKTEESINEASSEESSTLEDERKEPASIFVYVCGAVNKPGVYELFEGSRIVDAVEASGGFLDSADENYVNLAAKLEDGVKLFIPTKEETKDAKAVSAAQPFDGGSALAGVSNSSENSGLININNATREELTSLPGIGNATAEKIVSYREQHGSFNSIEDIMKVSGIKDKLFSKIKDHITV